ncbi:MAG TPA: hypothetical protein VGK77_03870 [Candidatus Binatia bacterium]
MIVTLDSKRRLTVPAAVPATGGPFPRRFRRRGRRLDVPPHCVETELVEGAQSLPRAYGRSAAAPAGVLPVQVVSWLLDADV